MFGELARRGLTEDRGRRDHRGHVGRPQPPAREVHRRVVDVFQVDPRVREVRAIRERAQRHRLRRIAGADDLDRARALARLEDLAPRDQGPEDRVGEIGLGAHELTKRRERDDEHATRPRDPSRHVRALARQQVELTEKATFPVRGDDHLAAAIDTDDLGLALEHDDEVGSGIASPIQDVADRDRAHFTNCFELFQRALVEQRPGRGRSVFSSHRGHHHMCLALAPPPDA